MCSAGPYLYRCDQWCGESALFSGGIGDHCGPVYDWTLQEFKQGSDKTNRVGICLYMRKRNAPQQLLRGSYIYEKLGYAPVMQKTRIYQSPYEGTRSWDCPKRNQ